MASVAVVPLPSSKVHSATGPVVAAASGIPPGATSTSVDARSEAMTAPTTARVNDVRRTSAIAMIGARLDT